jgi:hypothetical protein
MLLQVHDELLLEGPEDDLRRIAPELCDIMVGAYDLKAHLHVDLKMGPNWEDMRRLIVAADDTVAIGDIVTTEEEEDADLVPDALQRA